jgi:Tfp pilus assembly protein PilN
LVPGLRERIATEAQLPILPADALQNVALGRTKLTPEQLVAASTTLAAPVGLALAPQAEPSSRLTALLPQEYLERVHVRRQARASAAAVAVLAMILTGVWVQRTFTVRAADASVRHTTHLESAVRARETPYLSLATKESSLKVRSASAIAALANDSDATALLGGVSKALPADVWLQSMSVKYPTAKAAGTVVFALSGTNPDAPAHWLTAMQSISLFSQVNVNGITVSNTAGKELVTFSSQATLAPGVLPSRAKTFSMPS